MKLSCKAWAPKKRFHTLRHPVNCIVESSEATRSQSLGFRAPGCLGGPSLCEVSSLGPHSSACELTGFRPINNHTSQRSDHFPFNLLNCFCLAERCGLSTTNNTRTQADEHTHTHTRYPLSLNTSSSLTPPPQSPRVMNKKTDHSVVLKRRENASRRGNR